MFDHIYCRFRHQSAAVHYVAGDSRSHDRHAQQGWLATLLLCQFSCAAGNLSDFDRQLASAALVYHGHRLCATTAATEICKLVVCSPLLTVDAVRQLSFSRGHRLTIDSAVLACKHRRAAQRVFCWYVQISRAFVTMPYHEPPSTIEWRRTSNKLCNC